MGKAFSFIMLVMVVFGFLLVAQYESRASTIYSAQSGYWSEVSTWEGGIVPDFDDDAIILSPHTITFDIDQATLLTFTLNSGALLISEDGVSGGPGMDGENGHDIKIYSNGDINISGEIQAGNGGAGGGMTVNAAPGDSASASGGNWIKQIICQCRFLWKTR